MAPIEATSYISQEEEGSVVHQVACRQSAEAGHRAYHSDGVSGDCRAESCEHAGNDDKHLPKSDKLVVAQQFVHQSIHQKLGKEQGYVLLLETHEDELLDHFA